MQQLQQALDVLDFTAAIALLQPLHDSEHTPPVTGNSHSAGHRAAIANTAGQNADKNRGKQMGMPPGIFMARGWEILNGDPAERGFTDLALVGSVCAGTPDVQHFEVRRAARVSATAALPKPGCWLWPPRLKSALRPGYRTGPIC